MSVGSPASTTLRVRLADDPDRLGSALDALFALHRARWPGSHWFAAAEAFHRDFAALALERGWLRLWVIELDGRPAAAWYGFRFEGIDSYYQGGRDPALTRERLGLVLTIHTVREAIADGIEEYRFLARRRALQVPVRHLGSRRGDDRGARGVMGRAALAARLARRRLSG